MWISQSQYDQLVKQRDDYRVDASIARQDAKAFEKQRDCYINLYQKAVEQLDNSRVTTDKALSLIDNIVNLTFGGDHNQSLQLVVLQAYDQKPKIFYEGKAITGDDITINFKDGGSSILLKETI